MNIHSAICRLGLVLWAWAVCTAQIWAQAPVEERRAAPAGPQQVQQRAGAAHREWQRAEYTRSQAELDVQRAERDHAAAVKRTEELKWQRDEATKALELAKSREAQTRKAYDAALGAVDDDWKKKAGSVK